MDEHTCGQCTMESMEVKDTVVQSGIVKEISDKCDDDSSENKIVSKENIEVTGRHISPINPDVTESQLTMEVSAHSMNTEKSSYKESDGATLESCETNMSLQYLTDEGTNNIIYTIYNIRNKCAQSPYFLYVRFAI